MREQRVIDPTQTTRRADSTDFNAASPHRAGHTTGIHPEDRPRVTDEQRQQKLRQAQYRYDDGTGDGVYDTRIPTSARRYQMPVTQAPRTVVRYHRQQVPLRRSRTQDYALPVPQQPHTRHTEPKAKQSKERYQWHWLVYVGLTVLVGLGVFVGGSLALNWWHGYQDDLHYGRPRTAQYDVRVGHNDAHTPSHFLAINLNKQVEIVEFPGGDATKAHVYIGPTLVGDGQDLTPITLEFRDVNRDGKPDMIVHVQDSKMVFINDNGQFRPAKPSDTITL